MKTPRSIAVVVLAAAAALAGCGGADHSEEDISPVTLTAVEGSEVKQVTLTERAEQRLGISTGRVARAPGGGLGAAAELIPYDAVVYDSDGTTWTYVQTAPRTYVRRPITVRSIAGAVANLADGPPPGTRVVVVGAPELLGAEAEISGEE